MPRQKTKLLDNSTLKITFTDKRITSYGGFSLIAKIIEKIGLKKAVEDMIPFKEESANGTGVFSKIVRYGLTVLFDGDTHRIHFCWRLIIV